MTNVAPRGVPAVPGISAFPELNVRTYVMLDGKPGIFFFSLDAASRLAVRLARLLCHLPYHVASMSVEARDGWIHYRSLRTHSERPAEFFARYRPVSPPQASRPGTLEHFLTERYCLYTLDRRSRVCRLEIHHRPWPLQAADAEIARNTLGDVNGCPLPKVPPILHFSKRQDMVAWPLTRISEP